MNNLAVFHYLLVALTFHLVRATRNDALEVTNHRLTLRTENQVTTTPLNGCNDITDIVSYRQCVGELRGRSHTWNQENPLTNYVLFTLSRRATVCIVNLTYSVDSTSETPKVSFCAAPNDIKISNTFPSLTCQEVTIEATNAEPRMKTIDMPFPNTTNSIVMEVITQGIKASFTATSVQFFGAYEVVGLETTSSSIPVTGTTSFDDMQTENMTNMTSGVPSPTKTSNVLATTLLILVSLSLLSLIFFV